MKKVPSKKCPSYQMGFNEGRFIALTPSLSLSLSRFIGEIVDSVPKLAPFLSALHFAAGSSNILRNLAGKIFRNIYSLLFSPYYAHVRKKVFFFLLVRSIEPVKWRQTSKTFSENNSNTLQVCWLAAGLNYVSQVS